MFYGDFRVYVCMLRYDFECQEVNLWSSGSGALHQDSKQQQNIAPHCFPQQSPSHTLLIQHS